MFSVFDYSGRSTPWEYWSLTIGFAILLIVAGAWVVGYENTHYGLEPRLDDGSSGLVGLALFALVVAPNLALKVRRYHDFGWSGWSVLWILVPFVNVFMEFMLLFRGPAPDAVAYLAEAEPRHINIYNTPTARTASSSPAPAGHIDQIARLADMHAQGVLTAQEFAAAKARVLRS